MGRQFYTYFEYDDMELHRNHPFLLTCLLVRNYLSWGTLNSHKLSHQPKNNLSPPPVAVSLVHQEEELQSCHRPPTNCLRVIHNEKGFKWKHTDCPFKKYYFAVRDLKRRGEIAACVRPLIYTNPATIVPRYWNQFFFEIFFSFFRFFFGKSRLVEWLELQSILGITKIRWEIPNGLWTLETELWMIYLLFPRLYSYLLAPEVREAIEHYVSRGLVLMFSWLFKKNILGIIARWNWRTSRYRAKSQSIFENHFKKPFLKEVVFSQFHAGPVPLFGPQRGLPPKDRHCLPHRLPL